MKGIVTAAMAALLLPLVSIESVNAFNFGAVPSNSLQTNRTYDWNSTGSSPSKFYRRAYRDNSALANFKSMLNSYKPFGTYSQSRYQLPNSDHPGLNPSYKAPFGRSANPFSEASQSKHRNTIKSYWSW